MYLKTYMSYRNSDDENLKMQFRLYDSLEKLAPHIGACGATEKLYKLTELSEEWKKEKYSEFLKMEDEQEKEAKRAAIEKQIRELQ